MSRCACALCALLLSLTPGLAGAATDTDGTASSKAADRETTAWVLPAVVVAAAICIVWAGLLARRALAQVARVNQALAEGLRRDQDHQRMQNTYEAVVTHEAQFRAVADIVRGWSKETAADRLARLGPDDLRTLHQGLIALEYIGVAYNLGLLHQGLLLRLIGVFYHRTVERLGPYIQRVRHEENIDRLFTDCQVAAEALRKLDEEGRARKS